MARPVTLQQNTQIPDIQIPGMMSERWSVKCTFGNLGVAVLVVPVLPYRLLGMTPILSYDVRLK